ncbi:amino acid transporter, partial [Mycobacterium kansasii]
VMGWHSVADLSDNRFWSTVVGVVWIVLMTYICYRGIEVSAKVLYALLSIQILMLIVFSVVGLVRVYTHTAQANSLHPSLSWFWPDGLDFGT